MEQDSKAFGAYVLETVADLTGTDITAVGGTDRLREDLGLDSMQSMELLSRISERFDIDPDMNDLAEVATVDDVIVSLKRYL